MIGRVRRFNGRARSYLYESRLGGGHGL